MPATKKSTIATLTAEDMRLAFKEADELLMHIAEENREPSFDERSYFVAKIGWDNKEVDRQLFRARNVLRWSQVAGTAANRTALKKQRDQHRELMQTDGERLRKEIEKLTNQLSELERTDRFLEKMVFETEEAAEHLRKLLPPNVQQELDATEATIKASIGREYHELKGELHFRDTITDSKNYKSLADHVAAVRIYYPHCVAYSELHGQKVFTPEWDRVRHQLRNEAEEMRPKVAELESEFQARLAELETMRDVYIA
jgi:dephospho-CoA kinase